MSFESFCGAFFKKRPGVRGSAPQYAVFCFFAATCSKKERRKTTQRKKETVFGVKCEKIVSVLFDTTGAKRTKNAEIFARCDERRGLRALDLRKLLKKFDQNFSRAARPLGKRKGQRVLLCPFDSVKRYGCHFPYRHWRLRRTFGSFCTQHCKRASDSLHCVVSAHNQS